MSQRYEPDRWQLLAVLAVSAILALAVGIVVARAVGMLASPFG